MFAQGFTPLWPSFIHRVMHCWELVVRSSSSSVGCNQPCSIAPNYTTVILVPEFHILGDFWLLVCSNLSIIVYLCSNKQEIKWVCALGGVSRWEAYRVGRRIAGVSLCVGRHIAGVSLCVGRRIAGVSLCVGRRIAGVSLYIGRCIVGRRWSSSSNVGYNLRWNCLCLHDRNQSVAYFACHKLLLSLRVGLIFTS